MREESVGVKMRGSVRPLLQRGGGNLGRGGAAAREESGWRLEKELTGGAGCQWERGCGLGCGLESRLG